MRQKIWLALCVVLLSGAVFLSGATALEPLRLQQDSVRSFTLTPYIEPSPNTKEDSKEAVVFAIQNSGDTPLVLLLVRHAITTPLAAFIPATKPITPLRLFSSDDEEFATTANAPDEVRFIMPPQHVQSFTLFGADDTTTLAIWLPDYHQDFTARRGNIRQGFAVLLGVLALVAAVVAIYRRSMRAFYAIIMAGGLAFLLAILWRASVPSLTLMQAALASAIIAGAGTHSALLRRGVLHRNYWTRVLIIADIFLAAACVFWVASVLVWSNGDIGATLLGAACATMLLGGVFVPDRRHR